MSSPYISSIARALAWSLFRVKIPLGQAYEPLRRFFAEFPYETNPFAIITRIHTISGFAYVVMYCKDQFSDQQTS
jgi:hypothetical protein